MRKTLGVLSAALALASAGSAGAQPPTIAPAHGAFAHSSDWNGVIAHLRRDGFEVVTVADPPGSPADDAALVRAQPGSVVVLGPSYGGQATGGANVDALVYLVAFRPEPRGASHVAMVSHPDAALAP